MKPTMTVADRVAERARPLGCVAPPSTIMLWSLTQMMMDSESTGLA